MKRLLAPLLFALAACAGAESDAPTKTAMSPSPAPDSDPTAETMLATFGGGCFWCVEAVLEQLPGVLDVRSGYMGGELPQPSYKAVTSGRSGHVEVVEARFDPARIGYEELLEWFWKLHDPTSLDRQGNDVGPQYRSVIFTHSPEQARQAEESRLALARALSAEVVTEIRPATTFWPAEDYHQDYYRQNASQPYCRYVIAPKLDKLGLEK